MGYIPLSGTQLWLCLTARVRLWPSTGAGRGQYAGSALLRNDAVHTVLTGPCAVSCLVFSAQSARSCRFTLGGVGGRRSQRINLTQAVSRQKEWLLRVHDNGEERLRSMKSCRDVIHDASNLLDVRPACVVEPSVARFARTKDQTAHGTWPRKHSVHGLVAQSAEPAYWRRRRPALGQRLHAANCGLQGNAETLHDAEDFPTSLAQ